MKVKQIISELGPSNGSLAPIQNGKQQYKVSPNSAPAAPGQSQMVKLVPAGAPQGTPGQDPQGTVTVSADQIDMTDPANPKLNPQALNPQAQTPNQQAGALNGKTVTMGLGEEPNEDLLQPNTAQSANQQPNVLDPANNTNTYYVNYDQMAAKVGNKYVKVMPSKLWWELTPDVAAKANQQGFSTIYLNVNGTKIPAVMGGDQKLGSRIDVSPKDYQTIKSSKQAPQTNQPLQQEEQGEESPLSRIAHLAGIR